jgi:hypothetical protein
VYTYRSDATLSGIIQEVETPAFGDDLASSHRGALPAAGTGLCSAPRQEGMVPLREDGRLYHKHIDELTREDSWARLEAERVTAMWLRGRIVGERIAAQLRAKARNRSDD